jgi:hypothetical protein
MSVIRVPGPQVRHRRLDERGSCPAGPGVATTGPARSPTRDRLVAGAAGRSRPRGHPCGSDGHDRDGPFMGVLPAGRARRRGPRGPGHPRLLASHLSRVITVSNQIRPRPRPLLARVCTSLAWTRGRGQPPAHPLEATQGNRAPLGRAGRCPLGRADRSLVPSSMPHRLSAVHPRSHRYPCRP